jgi:uncharacterized membrane protein
MASKAQTGMGLATVALGVAKLAAPRTLVRVAGIRAGERTPWLVRALGAREVVIGLGLLSSRRPVPWLWSRVAGDALHLALLAAAVGARRAGGPRAVGALAGLAGIAALDVACAVAATRSRRTTSVTRSITIARPREDVYRYWRDFANAPAFMADIESVAVLDARRSRWCAHGPVGPVVSWEVEVAEDLPGQLLRWASVEGAQSDVRARGVVRLSDAPDGRGTQVEIELGYGLPDDAPDRAAAFVTRAATPDRIEAALARARELLETGWPAG